MRRTRVPNFIPIWRWEKSEKSGEPKTGGWVLEPQGGVGSDFKTKKNIHGQSWEEHVGIPNFIPIGRWKRGEKSGEPKTGEKKKTLVLDAKYADFKPS